MYLFRVHPWVDDAPPRGPGHPLYVHPLQSHGRIDNPEHYAAFYAADSAAGAIAEAWGNYATWTSGLLLGPKTLSDSVMALSTIDFNGNVHDLNEPAVLGRHGLRPSRVVTRHRRLTRAWALAFFMLGGAAGVRWWSYHDPDWGSMGLWEREALSVVRTEALHRDHFAVIEAGAVLLRSWRD